MNVRLISKSKIDTYFWAEAVREAGIGGSEHDPVVPGMEDLTTFIARASSERENKWKEGAKLIRFLIKHKHWSPFEHAYVTFEIVTSLPIATQFLRHRSFTFQQFSQRYAEATAFEPVELRFQANSNRQSSTDEIPDDTEYWGGKTPYDVFGEALDYVDTAYRCLLNAGVAKECARMILPQCTQTTLYMTGNLRSWIHFLELRDDPHAQKEAQEVAREIKRVFIDECPVIAEGLEWRLI